MEKVITGTVGTVQGKQTTKGTVFEVNIGNEKASTWKEPVAQEAKLLEGSTVKATIDASPNANGYPKNTLLKVELVDAVGGTSSDIPIVAASEPSEFQRPRRPEETANINRQSALGTAFAYAAAAGMDVEDTFALAKRIYETAMGKREEEPVAAGAVAETTEDIPW